MGDSGPGSSDSAQIIFLNLAVDFVAVDGEVPGGLNADFDQVVIDARNTNFDIVTDHDTFIDLPCEDKHGGWRVCRFTPRRVTPGAGRKAHAGRNSGRCSR